MSFKILQLSDTHFRQQYDDELEVMGIDYFPPHVLSTFLSTYEFDQIDCVVITGDLVHEGTREDYQAYQNVIDKHVPDGIPVFYTLGNHDRREEFYSGMTGLADPREQNVPSDELLYDYIVDFENYRFIMVDNYDPKSDTAQISNEQSDWIAEQLTQANQPEVILFMHHPLDIKIHESLPKTEVSQETRHVLQHPKLKGIFTGHVHMNRSSVIGNTPQWTSLSVYAGFHPKGNGHYYSNHLGFNVITLGDGGIDVFGDIITPTKKYYRQIGF